VTSPTAAIEKIMLMLNVNWLHRQARGSFLLISTVMLCQLYSPGLIETYIDYRHNGYFHCLNV